MITNIVTVGTTTTDLKTLMEAAGRTFPNDNDTCRGLIIQIDPASTEAVDVMSEGQTSGIQLSADTDIGPPSISYREFRVRNTYLKASDAGVSVRVLVEQCGG